ncbi:hypothetical protein [Gordonia rubripertincta]|uniref:hypothetical protein n=1 Tax=Gordonia rubripertincta TaxID=36822 RepID=UPI000B8D8324|nr:hypothetical protein [Gordonia rubripertincta]ASR05627.1 hypothetical protein GCWB2_24280 [Gordonia rubripertincta]
MPSSHTRSRSRHRAESTTSVAVRRAGIATVLTSSMAIGLGMAAAPALAVPQQGGVTPDGSTPQQGGVTPAPTPPPAVTAPGPGSLPAPPQEAPYQAAPTPDYDTTYTPVAPQQWSAPRPAPPVRPIAPPPEKIRIGNFVTDIPDGLSRRDVNSINAWSAYGEAKIAQGLISVGVPEDEASRQAAATIIGVMAGGTAGAVTLGVPAAVTGAVGGALIGAPVGAIIGATMFPVPFPGANTAPGAGIGAAAGAAIGAAALGIPAAVVGAVAGGTLGGLLAHALGAGDPGANPARPGLPGQQPPAAPARPALPNPGANQFEVHIPADQAAKSGLPAVDYTVTNRGDVNVSANIGGQQISAGWTAEQARAPYAALGPAGKQVEQTASSLTRQGADALKNLPNVKITWPQEHKPAPRR